MYVLPAYKLCTPNNSYKANSLKYKTLILSRHSTYPYFNLCLVGKNYSLRQKVCLLDENQGQILLIVVGFEIDSYVFHLRTTHCTKKFT